MKLPLEWLREYCSPEGFIVGRVLEAERHPDADRLSVCKVAVGEGDVAQIVCGAPNVQAGQTVAVAQPGAVMPDGTKLGKAKLRGVQPRIHVVVQPEERQLHPNCSSMRRSFS